MAARHFLPPFMLGKNTDMKWGGEGGYLAKGITDPRNRGRKIGSGKIWP